MKREIVFALTLIVSAPAPAAEPTLDDALSGFDEPAAADADPLDEALSGFDDAAPVSRSQQASLRAPWRLGGDAILSGAYNYAQQAPASGQTDYRGLSRLRARMNLRLDGDIGDRWEARVAGYAFHDFVYAIKGRDEFAGPVVSDLENEAELGDNWVRGKLSPHVDLMVGRQIVVWGKSDNVRVTDVLNPLDNREPGITDIEDLRLPVAMTRLDFYAGAWNLSALALHEIRFNKNPAFGSEFYPLPVPPPPGEKPDETEYGLAVNGVFSGWDLSFYAADFHDRQAYVAATPSGPEARHARLTMLGAATNVAMGNWLLKAEAARFTGLRYSSLPDTKARTDVLLGTEYAGFTETTLSLEVVDRYLEDYDDVLEKGGVKEHDIQTAFRYTGDFLHARLHLTAVGTVFEGDGGGSSRWQAKYDARDALSITGGVLLFHGGNRFPFSAYGDNDRVFAELKYSF